MRVLAIHSFYRQLGGEDVSFRSEVGLLRQRGHDVSTLTVQSQELAGKGRARQLSTLWFGDPDFEQRLARQVCEARPDVVYLNNWFPWLAPTIHHIVHAGPVLAAVRNHRMWCINGLLFRSGRVCRECLDSSSWRGVRHGCYEGAGSSLMATRLSRRVRAALVERRGVHFAVASRYMARFLADSGVSDERVHLKPNIVDPVPRLGPGGTRPIFVGRLEEAKGFREFLLACQQVTVKPIVVGDGPLRDEIGEAEHYPHLPHADVLTMLGRARVTVLPSRSPETFGRVAVESLGTGTPVIVSDAGALPEVGDSRCTAVVAAGDVAQLTASLSTAMTDGYWSTTAREMSREYFMRHYGTDTVAAALEEALLAASHGSSH